MGGHLGPVNLLLTARRPRSHNGSGDTAKPIRATIRRVSDRSSDETASVGECRRLLDEAAVAFRAGEIRSSADLALRAAELAAADRRGDLAVVAAQVVWGVPDPATAASVERMCRLALETIDPADLAGRAGLHAQLGVALHHRDRYDEARSHVELALELAHASGAPLATAAALHAELLSIAGADPGPGLLQLSDRMLAAAIAASSAEAELTARAWRVDALIRTGETTEAAHEIDSLDVLVVRSELPLARWNAALARAGLSHALGRFDEAEALARVARSALPPSQRGQTEPLFIAQLMLIATDRGSVPPEIAAVRAAAIGGSLVATAMTARYDLEMGDRASARAAFEALRPRLAGIPTDRRRLPTLLGLLDLAVAFDDVATATELRARLAPFDGSMIASPLGAVGPVAYFLARVEALLGEHDAAVAHAEAALDQSARGAFRPWVERSRLACADALLLRNAPGDRDRAYQAATLATVGAAQLGMARLLPQARALGERLAARGRLSPREHEVASLIAGGATNREIAGALVVSERTVETHVQNILIKLGFRSRTQIASWATGDGGARAPGNAGT